MSREWQNFEEVDRDVYHGQRLFRSGAPNYHGNDNTQDLTPTAVQFLVEKGINGIISFNQYSYTKPQIAMLDDKGIAYCHLPVKDFTAMTEDQWKNAIEFFRSIPDGSVLIHCGFGWGRTGTGVTAVQLFATWGDSPDESVWKSANHVEEEVQMEVLRKVRDFFRKD